MISRTLTYAALLAFLLLPPGVSAAGSPCEELGMEAPATNRCIALQKEFEIEKPVISSCKNYGKKDSEKLDCVHAGASVEAVRFCVRMHFKSADNALSCLHYTIDLDVAEACARLFTKESELIDCLKSGRDVSWLQGCRKADSNYRINCVQTGEMGPSRGLASESKTKK